MTRIPQTTVRIAVPGEDVLASNTMVFLVFKSLNSVVRAYSLSNDNSFSIPNVPQGVQATALVLRNVNGTFLLGQETAVIGTNHTFAPSMGVVSESSAVAAIQAL